MKNRNLIVAGMIAFAILLSVFAFQPEQTLANSEADAAATPKKRNIRTVQSPRANRNPLPTPSPETVRLPQSSTNPMPTPSPETIQSPKPRTKQRSGARSTGRRTTKPRN